jgi:hypothetical protein
MLNAWPEVLLLCLAVNCAAITWTLTLRTQRYWRDAVRQWRKALLEHGQREEERLEHLKAGALPPQAD